jgi:hypothetical protein
MDLAQSLPTADTRIRSARAQATTLTHRSGSALTLVLPVMQGREESLRTLLTDIGTHINSNTYFPFAELESVHFMRWVVVPPASSEAPAQLAFESNHDGTPEQHLAELFAKAPEGMQAIYQHCLGYPSRAGLRGLTAAAGADAPNIAFLLDHKIPSCAFYVGVPGLTMKQVRGEAEIRRRIEAYLRPAAPNGQLPHADPRAVYEGALALIRRDPALAAILDKSSDPPPRSLLRLATGLTLGLSALPALVPALFAIRGKEIFDKQTGSVAIPDTARALMAREDLQVQNQLTHVVPLKAGPLRAASARTVLFAIDFLAREWFTRGQLGGISSIHFARWVLIDEGKRLLFFSNYDGSWESYLGDFIDKAAVGLTSVWSNTQEFPKSLFLLFKGATDEERFKAWTRAHQITTQLWYSAYPDLTVRNILNNRAICAGLRRGLKYEHQLRRWLARF